jgi:hypothetical protein
MNLEDYFDHRFEYFHDSLKSIQLNYDLLRESDAKKLKVYERRLAHLLDKPVDPTAFKIELDGLNENRVTLDYTKMRKIRELEDIDQSQFNFANEVDLEDKLYENLEAATCILFEKITMDEETHKSERKMFIKDHLTEFIKKGYVKCRYGKIKVILYNISNDQMIKTKGFNKFNPKVLTVHLIRALKSNIEFFCAISIIYI